mmetsp:Transcript_962/g.1358  ORF Transcript_962/g.1358 Transcript_962/m.1358 type:complete len:854 (-) Transcript_962:240-2801(-)
MGFLTEGKPLDWKESESVRKYVREHGVTQFLNVWKKNRDRDDVDFLWGDEVEGFLVVTSSTDGKKSIKLNLRGSEILDLLEKAKKERMTEAKAKAGCFSCPPSVIFHPEYGRFMVETTPSGPYGGFTRDLRCVEANMRLRRNILRKLLKPEEIYSTLTTYPLLGSGNFTIPSTKPNGYVAKSDYVSDELINPHPRFATLTRNIRMRRGSKVDIRVPLFKDSKTPELEKEIKMDAMAFGMGCCCLQVTFLARNLKEARSLYDHLAVLGPIMLSLTAATPFFRGKVADIDARWTVISQSVDDRTPEERGLNGAAKEKHIRKSRYDSISCYISDSKDYKEMYNDLNPKIDKETYNRLIKAGVDKNLARHIAHLWIRDPLVIYREKVKIDDTKFVDHFENIQSTNWQSVRFKPPPDSSIGWRVEFRTMEVQITDFENAAFTVFVALVSRAILAFGLNLYIPISKVDINMKTAHKRDSVTADKFFWRKDVGHSVREQMQKAGKTAEVTEIHEKNTKTGFDSDEEPLKEAKDRVPMIPKITEVTEKEYKATTLDDFIKNNETRKFIFVYGEIEESGKSWCPSCERALPIIEKKMQRIYESSHLLKLPVSARMFCGNKEHPARKDLGVNSIPALIRVGPKGMIKEPLDSKWCTDLFTVNEYMSQQDGRRLRGGSTNDLMRSASFDDQNITTSIKEIMLGNGKDGPLGLIHVVHAYLDMIECDPKSRKVVNTYLSLIADRASGKLMTAATWLRNFVDLHPDYKKDSNLNEAVVHDLLKTCDGLTDGTIGAPQLLGKYANTGELAMQDRDGEEVKVMKTKMKMCLSLSKKSGKLVYTKCNNNVCTGEQKSNSTCDMTHCVTL